MNSIKNKIAAVVMCLVLGIFVLGTSIFIAEETDHSCTGNDCPVCNVIHFFETVIKEIASSSGAKTLLASALIIFAVIKINKQKQIQFSDTLISLKVELLN